MTAQPPQAAPEKPKMSLSLNGEDLNAANPQAAVVFALLEELGIQIPDIAKTASGIQGVVAEQRQAVTEQIKHPGHAQGVETIDQHAANRTSERPGPKVANPEPLH